MQIETRYKTMGRRFFASCIEGALYSLLCIVVSLLILPIQSGYSFVVLWSTVLPIYGTYVILSTWKWGGTIGKILMGLRVVDSKKDDSIRLRQSIFRELINLGSNFSYLASIYVFLSISNVVNYQGFIKFSADNPIIATISNVFLIVTFLELGSSIFSSRRRSVHDFIGGTVVVIFKDPLKGGKVMGVLLFFVTLIVSLIFINRLP